MGNESAKSAGEDSILKQDRLRQDWMRKNYEDFELDTSADIAPSIDNKSNIINCACQPAIVMSNHEEKLLTELNSIAVIFHIKGNHEAALENYEKILDMHTKRSCLGHSDSIILLQNLASVCLALGRIDEARKFHADSLSVQKRCLPTRHENLASMLNNVAVAYMDEGKYEEALGYFKQSHEILKTESSSNRHLMIELFTNMGTIYDKQGKLDEALKFYMDSLRMRKSGAASSSKLSPSPLPSGAMLSSSQDDDELLNSIGMIFYKQGKLDDALECFFQTLRSKSQSLTANHREIARSLNNIGAIFNKKRKFSRALKYYRQALSVQRCSLPGNHPDLTRTLNNIATLHYHQQRYTESLECLKEIHLIQRNSLSEIADSSNSQQLKHKQILQADIAKTLHSIGLIYGKLGSLNEALENLNQSYEIRKLVCENSHHPHHHCDVAASHAAIGSVYYIQDQLEIALDHFSRAFEILNTRRDKNRVELASLLNKMGRIYYEQGALNKSIKSYIECFELRSQQVATEKDSTNNSDIVEPLKNIGTILIQQGRFEEALVCYKRSLDIEKKSHTLASNRTSMSDSLNNIGVIYSELGKLEKAVRFYKQALRVQIESLPVDYLSIAATMSNIGLANKKLTRYDKSMRWFANSLEIRLKILGADHPDVVGLLEHMKSVQMMMVSESDINQ